MNRKSSVQHCQGLPLWLIWDQSLMKRWKRSEVSRPAVSEFLTLYKAGSTFNTRNLSVHYQESRVHFQHVLAWISLSASSFFCLSSTSWAASLALRSSTYQRKRQGGQEVRWWLANATAKHWGGLDEWTVEHTRYHRIKVSPESNSILYISM